MVHVTLFYNRFNPILTLYQGPKNTLTPSQQGVDGKRGAEPADGVAQCIQEVRRQIGAGADWIKVILISIETKSSMLSSTYMTRRYTQITVPEFLLLRSHFRPLRALSRLSTKMN